MRVLLNLPLAAINYANVTDMLAGTRIRQRTARRHFRDARVGQLRHWFRLFRVTAIALTVQRDPPRPLVSVAEEFALFDAAAVRHAISDVIGANTTDVGNLLGWEWMLWHGGRRLGLLPLGKRR